MTYLELAQHHVNEAAAAFRLHLAARDACRTPRPGGEGQAFTERPKIWLGDPCTPLTPAEQAAHVRLWDD